MSDFRIIEADCTEAMRDLDDASVDAVVTDPPYSLGFMGREWDTHRGHREFQSWCETWATEALRVLKPGGHLLAFGGTRTYHRLAAGIEDAGFEIRDCLAWLYGSGFPKSLDVSKAIDKAAGAEREVVGTAITGAAYTREKRRNADEGFEGGQVERLVTVPATPEATQWQGWGTALKPAHEPIVVARKPLPGGSTVAANVLEHGTGALNVDGCRIEGVPRATGTRSPHAESGVNGIYGSDPRTDRQQTYDSNLPAGRWPANVALDVSWEPILRLRDTLDSDAWQVLSEWCDARNGDVPPMRSGSRRPAESGEAPEVLLAAVPAQVDGGEPAGGSTPNEGAQAPTRIAGEDAKSQASNGQARPGESELEGLISEQRIPLPQPTRGKGSARASSRDGTAPRPTADQGRDRPPSERGQGRQPDRELGSSHAGRTHSAPRGSLSGAARASRPCREMLLRDVPARWLRFFDFTGDVARVGAAAMLDEQSGEQRSGVAIQRHGGGRAIFGGIAGGEGDGPADDVGYGDTGGASRFFYCAKTSSAERNVGLDGFDEQEVFKGKMPDNPRCGVCGLQRIGALGADPCVCDEPQWAPNRDQAKANVHPTVKPIALMRWLVRLVTPPEGTILDPFTGSGTTGCAAAMEGVEFVGIEREAEYVEIARARIAYWSQFPGAEVERVLASEPTVRSHRDSGQLGLLDAA